MSSILFKQKKRQKNLEPIVIAMYSIVPGIGQLYNGKTNKGILFLTASFVSFLMLLASINPGSTLQFALIILTTVRFFVGFIFKFEFEPSPAAEFLMSTIKFGGSFSTSLIVTIIGFVIYSMADAYMDAEKAGEKIEQKLIVTDSTRFRFSESTASSYILHALIFSMLFLMSLFLVIPSKDREQITEIEFIMPQIESKKPPPPETTRRSSVQSIDQGKHDPTKDVTPPQRSKPLAPPPRPVPNVSEPMITPPKPVEPPKPQAAPRPVPKFTEKPALEPAKPKPAPVSPSTTTTNSAPQPSPVTSTMSTYTSSTKAIAIVPRIPGVPGSGGIGNEGNPSQNDNPNAPPSVAAKKDIDFGPYMEELQRRIKRAWKPPRGNESKRVVVVFKISKAGQLSDLTIKKGSGFEPSDKAALLAVQEAAPFARLPEGAPATVDIEFTFDYNVFGAKESYRKY